MSWTLVVIIVWMGVPAATKIDGFKSQSSCLQAVSTAQAHQGQGSFCVQVK